MRAATPCVSHHRWAPALLLPSPAGAESVPASGSLNAVLIGGGVGCAPMLFAAKELRSLGVSVTAVAGFRKEPFLIEELKDAGARVVITTDMPTENAFLGTVVDCMEINEIRGDLYFSCGPRAMLSSLFLPEKTGRRCSGFPGGAHGMRIRRVRRLCL